MLKELLERRGNLARRIRGIFTELQHFKRDRRPSDTRPMLEKRLGELQDEYDTVDLAIKKASRKKPTGR